MKMTDMEPETCPNCESRLVKHRRAGRGQYKAYPNLRVCETCWFKYDPQPDGTLVRVKSRKR